MKTMYFHSLEMFLWFDPTDPSRMVPSYHRLIDVVALVQCWNPVVFQHFLETFTTLTDS